MSHGQSLRELFDRHATVSQAEFARLHGIGSAAMLSQYLTGRRPINLPAACKLARGLGLTLAEISPQMEQLAREAVALVGEQSKQSAPAAEYEEVRRVRLLLKPGATTYKAVPESNWTYIAFRADWLKERGLEARQLMALEAPDEGMSPTIARGDLVVLNVAEREALDGSAVAVNYEGDLLIRRLHRDEGKWWLTCDNPDRTRFRPKHAFVKQCYMLGRIVYRQSESI